VGPLGRGGLGPASGQVRGRGGERERGAAAGVEEEVRRET